MDRDAEKADRGDEARQGDTGMIGSESEEPGPGRDTSLTEPDPAAASSDESDESRGTVAMSEGDPMATRLGSHVEGAGAIGYDVAAAEEGATQDTPPDTRPGYETERPGGDAPAATAPAYERDPGLAAEPAVDQGSYGPGVAAAGERVDDAGPSDRSDFADEPPAPERSAFATEDAGSADRTTDEEPERLDRPGPQEPGVQEGIYDQDADQARQQRPSDSCRRTSSGGGRAAAPAVLRGRQRRSGRPRVWRSVASRSGSSKV